MLHHVNTKSRHGCQNCKKRHRKCDETRPSCLNCTVSHRRCSYLVTAGGRPLSSTVTRPALSSRSWLSPPTARLSGPLDAISTSVAVDEVSPNRPSMTDEAVFNMRHMELLHHFRTQLLHHPPNGAAFGLEMSDYFDLAIRQAFHAPWLMQQILAVSSLHLSYLQGNKQNPEATLLQMRGLALLNRTKAGLSAIDGLPACFFSVFVSVQAMSEALATRSSLPELLAQLLTWFRLARGIDYFLNRYSGPCLLQMKELIGGQCEDHPKIDQDDDDERRICSYFAKLMMYIETICIDDLSTMACKQAANYLHNLYHYVVSPNASPTDRLYLAVRWIDAVSSDYIQLIEQRCHGALVVLAHYGVMLHHARGYWGVSDSGQFIVESIIEYLDIDGSEPHVWLKEVLRSTD